MLFLKQSMTFIIHNSVDIYGRNVRFYKIDVGTEKYFFYFIYIVFLFKRMLNRVVTS